MKILVTTALLAMALSGVAFAQMTASQTAPAQDVPIVIHADRHSHAVNKFESVQNKSSYWKAEVQKKGYDVAYTEWMQVDHPMEFAAVCVKEAHAVRKNMLHSEHMTEFNALIAKRSDLKQEVQSMGYDAAFVDWLKDAHPDAYRTEILKLK
jgi:hypothetical protein